MKVISAWLVEKHSDVTSTMTARFEPVRMWVEFFSKEHPFSRLQELHFCILLHTFATF